MLATNSFIAWLASVLLCAALASAVPGDPMARPHIAYRRATPSTSSVTTTGSPIVSTEAVATATLGFPNPLSNATTTTSTSVLAPNLAPESGCTILTKRVHYLTKVGEYNERYCTCAGAPPSSVSAIMGYSSRTLSTYCSTGPGALPTDYIEVPDVSVDGPGVRIVVGLGPPIPSTDDSNCTNGEVVDPGCWYDLGLELYVEWWWDKFQHVCEGQGFAQYFFRAMTPYTSADCSKLIFDGPCQTPHWDDFKDIWNGVANFYVAYHLYSINEFFLNYWAAIGFAGNTAALKLGNIIDIVNPIKKPDTTLDTVLKVLTFGLALIPGPESKLVEVLVKAIQQAPGVAGLLLPTAPGTVESQLLEWHQDSGHLGTAITNLQNNVTKALSAIETDVATFVTLARSGAFLQQIPDVNDLNNQLLYTFNAFLISQAYHMSGVFIARQPHTSVRQLATNGTKLNFDTLCKTDYDSHGVCDSFWYDSDDDTTYSLVSKDQVDQKDYNKDMQVWFSDYTSPAILFKTADLCAHAQKPQEGSPPSTSQVGCFSSLKVCTWNLDPQPDASKAKANPPYPAWFSDCTNDKALPGSTGSTSLFCWDHPTLGRVQDHDHVPEGYGGNGIFVPRTYLGWEILDNDVYAKAKNIYGECSCLRKMCAQPLKPDQIG